MKKIISILLASTLGLALILTGLSCASSPAITSPPSTPVPVTTPPPTSTFPPTPGATQVPYQDLALNVIQNSSTFKFDGVPGSLKISKIIGSAQGTAEPTEWEFAVEFQTTHPGHGDRSGQVLAQVITAHTALVTVKDGKVTTAVCDGTWDLLTDKQLTAGEENARRAAAEFIQNSSTFKFDGIPGSIEFIKSDPGWTSAFRSTVFTFQYQTRQPGHGDRSGQVLAQVITDHTAVVLVNIETNQVALAICDKEWDMVHDKNPPVSVSGTVVSGGDTTPPGGPQDAPRVFLYRVQKADGTFINVSYTAYPPSPAGDANRGKITLDFYAGAVNIGDRMEAYGTIDKTTQTVVVADQGDYIRTYAPKMEVAGVIISGGDTSAPNGPLDVPRRFVYTIRKEDGSSADVAYTAYPPSPVGDAARAKIELSFYDGAPKAGDYLKAYGTYSRDTNTITLTDEGDFMKTYPQKPQG